MVKYRPLNAEYCRVSVDSQGSDKMHSQQFFLDVTTVILVIIELVALLDLLASHFGASIGLLAGGAVSRGHKLATGRPYLRAGGFALRSGVHSRALEGRRQFCDHSRLSMPGLRSKPGRGAHCDRSFGFKSSQTYIAQRDSVCRRLSTPWCVIRVWLFNNFL